MIKTNIDRFWIVTTAAAALLIAVWATCVAPKIGRRTQLHAALLRLASDLEAAKADTPSRVDIRTWNKYRAALVHDQDAIATFFADHSASLNRWFPDIPKGPDGDPPRDAFVARYRDEATRLEQALRQDGRGTAVGGTADEPLPGFRWEDLRVERWEGIGREDERAILRALQKRFWVRERVARVALKAGARVKRVVDFRFFSPLHDRFREVENTAGDGPAGPWPGIPSSGPGVLAGQREKPLDPAWKLVFGVCLELPYSEVPKAIREVLSPGTQAGLREEMLITLLGTKLSIRTQNQPLKRFDDDSKDDGERQAKEREILEGSKPGNVWLTIAGQVMDFEAEKMR